MTKPTPIPSDDERTDLALLSEHGIEITDRTRELLWFALDMHDVSRDAWATAVMQRAFDEGRDPIAALRRALIEWLHGQNERARLREGWARWKARTEKREVDEKWAVIRGHL